MNPSRFDHKETFESAMHVMCMDVAAAMSDKGFEVKLEDSAKQFMLMVTEIAEACEADRHGNPADRDLPRWNAVSVELADAVIRIMHFCGVHSIPIGKIVVEKCRFNEKRPHKHGKAY